MVSKKQVLRVSRDLALIAARHYKKQLDIALGDVANYKASWIDAERTLSEYGKDLDDKTMQVQRLQVEVENYKSARDLAIQEIARLDSENAKLREEVRRLVPKQPLPR